MATDYTSIYDLFLMLVKDYNLMALYQQSESDFNNYLQGWLLFAINEFDICNQNLGDRDDTAGIFNVDLTLENKILLSELMVKYWLTKEVQDIFQMHLHLQDRDFKTYAESQNLQSKADYLSATRERCSQLLIDYGYKHANWDAWFGGNFRGV